MHELNVKVTVCLPAVACDNTADISVPGATKALTIKTPPELGELECARLSQKGCLVHSCNMSDAKHQLD